MSEINSNRKQKTIDEIYSGLREYGYEIEEILAMNETPGRLAGLLAALEEDAAKPGSPEWFQFEADERLRTAGKHAEDGRRVHFCKYCGETIVFGPPSDVTTDQACTEPPQGDLNNGA